jgi:hypothetical protein
MLRDRDQPRRALAAVSGLIVIFTLLLMLLAQGFAALTRQLR